MDHKDLKLEDTESPHTLGGASYVLLRYIMMSPKEANVLLFVYVPLNTKKAKDGGRNVTLKL